MNVGSCISHSWETESETQTSKLCHKLPKNYDEKPTGSSSHSKTPWRNAVLVRRKLLSDQHSWGLTKTKHPPVLYRTWNSWGLHECVGNWIIRITEEDRDFTSPLLRKTGHSSSPTGHFSNQTAYFSIQNGFFWNQADTFPINFSDHSSKQA